MSVYREQPHPCLSGGGHKFEIARRDWFKKNIIGQYDPSVSFSTLFCPKCGESKEIVSADQRHKDSKG